MGFFDFIYQNNPEITVMQARERALAGEVLIDIREIYEWNKGHAQEALHIPVANLIAAAEEYGKETELMLICASGHRSLHAANRLKALGFKAVSVHGGTTAWKSAGFPIVKPDSR